MPGDDDWCLSSKYSNDDTKFEPFWYTYFEKKAQGLKYSVILATLW